MANRIKAFSFAVILSLLPCSNTQATGIPGEERSASLQVISLLPDRSPPQAAEMATVRWEAKSTGGVGAPTYAFWISNDGQERSVQEGPSASWSWSPSVAGNYRVKVVVTDSIGNSAERAWASYEISPPFERDSPIAVMPMENLSGTAAPVREIRSLLMEILKARGFIILEDRVLDVFMEKHRMRYASALTKELGEALRVETGARGVLFPSLDHYEESSNPKIALTARVVYAGRWAGILWMDGVTKAGNDSPGILGLGLIRDPRILGKEAIGQLVESLEKGLGKKPWEVSKPPDGGRKFRPKEFYTSHRISSKMGGPLTIAVLPFRNRSTRRNAGEIMTLHFIRHLLAYENVIVVEPGVVRQALLTSRTIMEQGLSLPQADLLRDLLEVDLVVGGWVMDYQDYSGPLGEPKVDFSSEVIDTKERKAVWSSVSYGRGSDGVFFFDAGKVNTAYTMASGMAREVVRRILQEETETLQAASGK